MRQKKTFTIVKVFLIIIAKPGNVLLSHTATRAVPLAMKSLTSVFGMGTGVSFSL